MEDHRDDVSVGRDDVAEEEEGEECDAAEGEGEHHRGRDRGTGKEEGENATNEVADGETEKTTSWDKEALLPSSFIVDGSTNGYDQVGEDREAGDGDGEDKEDGDQLDLDPPGDLHEASLLVRGEWGRR